jgi:phenylalanyl-tRNA synthetase beta chain
MLVSWQWLGDYVRLGVEPSVLADRFALSGLNHEQTFQAGNDTVIELEVTSNRGDCLGHIGVAREAAVLLGQSLCVPAPKPAQSAKPCSDSIRIENRFPTCCSRYTARVICGVKIGPSPEWLVDRLAAVGVKSVNNVVDVTNYVMLECGQPLHAFDLDQIHGGQLEIRPAASGEQFVAIDHRTYTLDDRTVVIADANRAIALGGVMGGAETEISATTTNVLIETALFEPLAIRRTARTLKLQSPSSFRFERRPDPAGVDWASLRACELILQVAGGELQAGVVSVGQSPALPPAITLRLNQIPRILGIEVPSDKVVTILQALGCSLTNQTDAKLSVTAPSWRSDLTREADLIEEVARIFGYDQIPENAVVPMTVAQPRRKDMAVQRMRNTLSCWGIDEAMTPSVVALGLESVGSLWTDSPPLATETPLLEGARWLRRGVIPSLLAARHANQVQSIRNAQVYEIANVVLPSTSLSQLPKEYCVLGMVTAGDLRLIRGCVESILGQLGCQHDLKWLAVEHPLFAQATAMQIRSGDQVVGWLGQIKATVQEQFNLDAACAAAELNVDLLTGLLVEVRRAKPYSSFPAIQRDLNFIVDETLSWAELQQLCRQNAGPHIQAIEYVETYRDAKKDGPDKKRILLSLNFQSMDRTLTSDEVEQAITQVISACDRAFSAKLLG